MSVPIRDDGDQPSDRQIPTGKHAKLSSPRADAFSNGRRFRWTETADDPFDEGKYWEFYSGTD